MPHRSPLKYLEGWRVTLTLLDSFRPQNSSVPIKITTGKEKMSPKTYSTKCGKCDVGVSG